MSLALGIDIGGTNTIYGVVNEQGEVLVQGEISTKGHTTADEFIDTLFFKFNEVCSTEMYANVVRIGVGAPNGNYYSGNIEHAANLEWKGIIPLAKLVEEKFNRPTKITNDANAAAMGEMMYGAAKGMNDFIMVTLGTGVGSGFVANGKLIYGHDGFAGELGHVISIRDGRKCGCGRKGCLETYTSATGIVTTANEFLQQTSQESSLRLLKDISSKDIFKAAQQKDAIAMEIFNYTGKILGQTLADAVAITSPEAIILFGGLAQAGSFIFEPTQKAMEENLLINYKGKVKLIPSLLKDSNVAILGSAALQ
jgi:glucokinase